MLVLCEVSTALISLILETLGLTYHKSTELILLTAHRSSKKLLNMSDAPKSWARKEENFS